METETLTTTRPTALSPVTAMTAEVTRGGVTWVKDESQDGLPGLMFARHELRALVQFAYDQHGILAEPSLAVEAAR